jgi:Caspase domain/FG-GAP-like repeat/FG-GAP repeat
LHATAEPEAPARRRRALLVATATYADPGLAALRAPTGDVEALAGVLEDGSIGEFEVTRLVDRPTEELKKEIEGFFGGARRDDLLLLYFSCHGVLSQSRRFYFATATTALQWLRATAIEDGFVNDVVQHSRARSVVLVLDCCHSGAFGKGLTPKSALTVDVEHRFEGRGRVTLSASTELEYAFEEADPATGINELEPAAPGSLFTRCLVDGLASGDADMDGDGRISVDELYDYVCQRMRDGEAHQTPGMAGDVRGEIVIARSPRRVALPEELRQAVDSRLAGVREGAVGELAALLDSTDPGVVEAARAGLERLTRDDSQRVSARAREALGVTTIEPPTVVLPPDRPSPPAPVRRHRRPRRGVLLGAGAVALAAVAAAVAFLPGGYSGPAIAYDFGGDGKQEIAIAPAGAAAVLLHPGPDGDEVTTVSTEAAGGSAAGLTSADFDGDGHSDLAVGVPPEAAVTIFYGNADGISPDRRQRLRADDFELPSAAGRYGANILGRDFDDDGYADLAVGAPGNPTEWETGAVQILFGSEQGIRKQGARLLEQPTNGEISAFGARLRSGDIDGDGSVDLVEGSPDPREGDTAGHLAWCPGGSDGPTACTALPLVDDDGGTSALAVADVTGDGRQDIVQSDADLPSGSGGLRLWRGTAEGPSPDALVVTPDELSLDAGASDDEFGAALDAGQLDDDDNAEIVVGAPGYAEGAGAVAVVDGAPDGFALTGHRLLQSNDPGDGFRLGSTLSMLRLDGPDERADVVTASEGAEWDGAVQVMQDQEFVPVPGLSGAAQGSTDEVRIGRTAGP